MRFWKRSLYLIVAFLVVLSIFALISCSKNKGDEKVVNLEEEIVVLGKMYETEDKITYNGQELLVKEKHAYKVSDGKEILLIEGAFDATDILGYYIEYFAELDGEVVKYVKQIAIKDIGNPVISITPKKIAYVGKKYIYPVISIKDDSKQEIPYEIKVVSIDDEAEVVNYDKEGFVPNHTGYYQLIISASDSSDNNSIATYDVYARTTTLDNEIESINDGGIELVAYSKSGTKQTPVEFTSFKRLASSNGSCYFEEGEGSDTGFYVSPRNTFEVMEKYGANSYISVWLYALSMKEDDLTVSFGNAQVNIRPNEWQEIRLDSSSIGNYQRFFDRISHDTPLFTIQNNGSDFGIFVDSIYVCDGSDIRVNSLNSNYDIDSVINVTDLENVNIEYLYSGVPCKVEGNSFTADKFGEYYINVYKKDFTAFYTKKINVGQYSSYFDNSNWFVNGNKSNVPSCYVENNSEIVDCDKEFYLVNMENGVEEKINEFDVPNGVFAIKVKTTIDNKEYSSITLFKGHNHSQGAWFAIDEKSSNGFWIGNEILSTGYLESYDGYNSVLKLSLREKGEAFFSNRNYWTTIYSKDHYENFNKLTFTMKASKPGVQLAYIAEDSWTPKTIASEIATEWKTYRIDLAEILDKFEGFSAYQLFYILSNNDDVDIYISDISCEKIEVSKNVWYEVSEQFTQSMWIGNNNLTVDYADQVDDKEGVLAFNLATAGEAFFSNRSVWKPVYGKDYYYAYNKLTFTMKASKAGMNLDYIAEDGWISNAVGNNISTEWKKYTIDLGPILDNYDKFISSQLFYINSTQDGSTLYISDISCENVTVATDSWLDFGDASTANVWNSAGTTTWLEAYEGANGVLLMETSAAVEDKFFGATEGSAVWKPTFEKENYSGKNVLKFKILVETEATYNLSFFIGNNDKWYGHQIISRTGSTDGYEIIAVEVEDIEENYDYYKNWCFLISSTGAVKIYIDSITVL